MKRHDRAGLWLCMCAVLPVGKAVAKSGDGIVPNDSADRVSIGFGSLRVTSEIIELRCEVTNETGQDIWLYAGNYDQGLAGEGRPWRGRVPASRLLRSRGTLS